MKIKVYKNLFQFLCAFGGILFVDVLLLWGYFEFPLTTRKDAWFLPMSALAIFALFFLADGYWIFQKVIIDENGLKIVRFGKVLYSCKLEEMEYYRLTNVMRNPSISIKTTNSERMIHLDRRRKILVVLQHYHIYEEFYNKM